MLIDERIEELSEGEAKKLLRRAVEEIAGSLACEKCAVRFVCGAEPSQDDCMWRVLAMLSVSADDEAEAEPEGANAEAQPEDAKEADDARTVYYDPETMRIVD